MSNSKTKKGELNLEGVNEQLKKAHAVASDAQRHSSDNRNLIIAGLWVVGIGFAALLLTAGGILQSYIAARTNTFQSLVDKINEQNVKIDLLYQEMREHGKTVTPPPQP